MNRRIRLLGALALAAFAGSCASPRPSPIRAAVMLRIDGSTGVKPLVAALAREFSSTDPGVLVTMGPGMSATERLDAVGEGRIEIAIASHGVAAADIEARGLVAHQIARAAVVFAVHSSVPLALLTRQQLCELYAGTITSWRDLGGPELPIVPLTRPAGEVDADVVHAALPCVAAAAGTGRIRSIARPEDMASVLGGTPGGIGMTSLPFVLQSDGRLRALAIDGISPGAAEVRDGRYSLVRPTWLVTRISPPDVVRRFLAYVRSAGGTAVIQANGAVAVP